MTKHDETVTHRNEGFLVLRGPRLVVDAQHGVVARVQRAGVPLSGGGQRTNQTQEAWVYSHDGPIGHGKRGYILTTDQSDAGSVGIFLRWTNRTREFTARAVFSPFSLAHRLADEPPNGFRRNCFISIVISFSSFSALRSLTCEMVTCVIE
eukprot:5551832-Pyramimonas_sp.AAC.1